MEIEMLKSELVFFSELEQHEKLIGSDNELKISLTQAQVKTILKNLRTNEKPNPEYLFEKYGIQIHENGIKWLRKEDFNRAINEYLKHL